MKRAFRLGIIALILAVIAAGVGYRSSAQSIAIDCVSPSPCTVTAVVTPSDVEAGLVSLDPFTLDLTTGSSVSWDVTASVSSPVCPSGTANCVAAAVEIENNGTGTFNAGSGTVQSGTGSMQFDAFTRLNLNTLTDAPAGTYEFTITYTATVQ